jgi:enoyl-CoA hydratase/carnithine racemase
MSGYQHILLDRDTKGRIATLTLNRPDRRNALNDLMQDEIAAAETITLTSADHAEGIAAFRESRQPIFEDK